MRGLLARVPIGLRFGVLILMTQAALIAWVVHDNQRLSNAALTQLHETRLTVLTSLLSASLTPLLVQRDIAALQESLDRFGHLPAVRYLKVDDARGRRLAEHTHPHESPSPADAAHALDPASESAALWETAIPLQLVGQTYGTLHVGISTDIFAETRQGLIRQSLRNGLIGLAGLLLVIVPLAIWVSRRLGRLDAAARSIAAGDLDQRLDDTGDDEIGRLAVSFNRMADALGQRESALREAKADLERIATSKYRILFEATTDAVMLFDRQHGLFDCNPAALGLLGCERDALLGAQPSDLAATPLPVGTDVLAPAPPTGRFRENRGFEWCLRRRDTGDPVEVEVLLTSVQLDGSTLLQMVARDIGTRKAAEEEIRELAFFDPLTRLPNRRLLLDRLQQALATGRRKGRCGALFYIDLDDFKTLNDTLGHDQGDRLLQLVARRLSARIRESDTLARLGGDEFVVMVEHLSPNPIEAASQAETLGNGLLGVLRQPYDLDGQTHFSSASIGITLFDPHPMRVEELMKQGDMAMYRAKAAGRNTLRFFDPSMQSEVSARATLEAQLRCGLRDERFLLYYQVQVDRDGTIIGAECLLRWQDQQGRLIPPAAFIPLAEQSGLILPIGHWVLQTACTQLAAWSARTETAQLTLAVNISARQFRRTDFVDQVLACIEDTGANPARLKLEITESLLLDDVEDTVGKMIALKARGVSFALDDFGTGYSSLSYLKRLPFDQLKIDRSFVLDVLTDTNAAAIARTIIALGRTLELAVIAEGVETEEQRDWLAAHGCHVYQGYFFGRPEPLEHLSLDAPKTFIRPTARG